MASRGIAETSSGSPRVNANPADVVARASNPRCWRYRAVPTSHGLGITKQPDACNFRNLAMADRWAELASFMPRSYTAVRRELKVSLVTFELARVAVGDGRFRGRQRKVLFGLAAYRVE